MRNICGDLTRNGLVLKARQESSQRCKPLENWNNNLSTESAKDFIGRLTCRIVSVALSELERFSFYSRCFGRNALHNWLLSGRISDAC
jgi:hypothetical protein